MDLTRAQLALAAVGILLALARIIWWATDRRWRAFWAARRRQRRLERQAAARRRAGATTPGHFRRQLHFARKQTHRARRDFNSACQAFPALTRFGGRRPWTRRPR